MSQPQPISIIRNPSRLLGLLADFVSARPKLVLVVSAVLAVAAATQVPFLEVTTSRTNLGHAMSDTERRFGEFLEEFGSPNDLIAVIDMPAPAEGSQSGNLERTADDLAATLGADKDRVRSTFHKIDLDFFLRRILLFVPAKEMPQIKRVLESSYVDDVRQGKIDGLDAIVEEFITTAKERPSTAMDPTRVADGMSTLKVIIEEMDRRIKDPDRHGLEGLRGLVPPLRAGAIDDHGYLQSRDGGIRLVFVRPVSKSDENSVVLPLVTEIRARAAEVAARHPGTRIRLTGLPAVQADETVIVDRDMFVTTVISLLLISLILLYGYRKPQQVLLSLVPLLAGILYTLAIVRFTYGRINIVGSVFLPVLLGRGSDFAIYVIARFNAARTAGRDGPSAVRESLEAAGGGIVTGALVTSAAFLVATFGQFGMFRQLGVLVGVGLVMILVASLLITPALLLLVGDRRMPGEEAAERLFGQLPSFGAGPGGVGLRHPIVVLLNAAALLVILGVFAGRVPFDYDLLKFLPADAESVQAQHALTERSNYGVNAVVIAAPSIEEARRLAAELERKPNVGRVESIASFLPDDQDAKLAAIATLRDDASSIPPILAPTLPTKPGELDESLGHLVDLLEDSVYTAEQASKDNEKLRPVVDALTDFGKAVEAARKTLKSLPEAEAQSHIATIERDVFGLLSQARDRLRENVLDAKKVETADLPPATRERFMGRTGKSAIYVFPKSQGAGEELTAFVNDVRSVAPEATGFPVIYFESSRSIKRGFYQSASLALLVIVLALLLHFRRAGDAAIALVPLALGAVAMLGLMRLLSIDNNVANIAALPLLLGLGTDYGLQIVHHRRTVPADSLATVLEKTGLGVFMAGGTTAAGFGALALARHLGGRSLGIVLFLGTSAALFCSLVVLPALLEVIERRKPKEP